MELYFRQNVVLEPLFCRWYAWWYLISPVTAPLYVVHQQIVESNKLIDHCRQASILAERPHGQLELILD